MRILIIGGNGRTGKLVVQEALKRGLYISVHHQKIILTWDFIGHQVTALVRNFGSLEAMSGLTVVQGTKTNSIITRAHAKG
jgi:uncharacterized protein YbjT (DUF2867 family)